MGKRGSAFLWSMDCFVLLPCASKLCTAIAVLYVYFFVRSDILRFGCAIFWRRALIAFFFSLPCARTTQVRFFIYVCPVAVRSVYKKYTLYNIEPVRNVAGRCAIILSLFDTRVCFVSPVRAFNPRFPPQLGRYARLLMVVSFSRAKG